jgi:TDG/mug DNA glycosylase family protein
MALVRSFLPIEDRNSEVLILGSMPGVASLTAGRYYAHPHNAFWRIVTRLLGLDAGASYEERVRALKTARIAVWDVLESCAREGSLDSSIDPATQCANDFESFFRTHPRVRRVFFNGTTAEACFRRHVAKSLDVRVLAFARLPSTSPAHASLTFERKLKAWRAIVRHRRSK